MNTRIALRGQLCGEFKNYVAAARDPARAAHEFLRRIAASPDPNLVREQRGDTIVIRRRHDFGSDAWPLAGSSHG